MRRCGMQINCPATSGLTLTKQLLERAGEPSDSRFGRRVFDHVCHINFALVAVRTSTSHPRGSSNSTDSIVVYLPKYDRLHVHAGPPVVAWAYRGITSVENSSMERMACSWLRSPHWNEQTK